eukprot:scaffold1245_cov109-Cylindrotheca_fusiformis.AAC.2
MRNLPFYNSATYSNPILAPLEIKKIDHVGCVLNIIASINDSEQWQKCHVFAMTTARSLPISCATNERAPASTEMQ